MAKVKAEVATFQVRDVQTGLQLTLTAFVRKARSLARDFRVCRHLNSITIYSRAASMGSILAIIDSAVAPMRTYSLLDRPRAFREDGVSLLI